MSVVGLIPAGGNAARMGRIPGSKELLVVGFESGEGDPRPKPVCTYLLDQLSVAAVRRTVMVIGEGKWDIPAYLGDGERWGVDIAYLTVAGSDSTPRTVARAYRHISQDTVAFGFPDIILRPGDVFARLIERHRDFHADVTLGVFPVDDPGLVDVIAFDGGGAVREISIKPARTELTRTWLCAVWEPSFTRFLSERMDAGGIEQQMPHELYMGDVLVAAIAADLDVRAVAFDEGSYRDVGTPAGFRQAIADVK